MLPAGAVPAAVDAALIENPACWAQVVEEASPAPDGSWTVSELRSWASSHDVDLGAARKKADILMVLGDEGLLAGEQEVPDGDRVGTA